MKQINHEQLDEILADFSALSHTTYLDGPWLGFGYADWDSRELGIPDSSISLSQVPVLLVERHQELWTHPDNGTPEQEAWTEQALSLGMQRIGTEMTHISDLEGWLIAEWPRDGGGLQLQQPDGNLFVYTLCQPDPAWMEAVRELRRVLVLHGPSLGLRVPPDHPQLEQERAAALQDAKKRGLVTGGLIHWGQLRGPRDAAAPA